MSRFPQIMQWLQFLYVIPVLVFPSRISHTSMSAFFVAIKAGHSPALDWVSALPGRLRGPMEETSAYRATPGVEVCLP